MEIRKHVLKSIRHQEYMLNSRHQKCMLNSNTVITDCDKNKDDNAIHGNINDKEENESISNNDTGRVRQKHGRREHV